MLGKLRAILLIMGALSSICIEGRAQSVVAADPVVADSIAQKTLREGSVKISDLPEFVKESKRHRILHVLAYVREYSSMTSYTDTVFLFREKMVDYMLPESKNAGFRGWSVPRILTCRSYYRFTDNKGLDSVSNSGRHHFSWSDWIGLSPKMPVIPSLRSVESGTDTVKGKYSAGLVWNREKDRVSVEVNVLSDTLHRKWVPTFAGFFRDGVSFDRFKVKYNFANVLGDTLLNTDLTDFSVRMESKGRGHNMFRFTRRDQPIYVDTDAEVYILDKEFISAKEARRWDKAKFDIEEVGLYQSPDAPPLSPAILALVDRVDRFDMDSVRMKQSPDRSLVSNHPRRNNFSLGNRILSLIKGVTGISAYKASKNRKNQWREFKKEQIARNRKHPAD